MAKQKARGTQRARDVVFSILVAAVFLCVIGYDAAAHMLPGVERPTESLLEQRHYSDFPDFSEREGVQDRFEGWVADRVPFRDEVLLANGTMQRSLIALANVPFGFDAYPALFGGADYCIPSLGRVAGALIWEPSEFWERPTVIAAGCSALVERHPEVNWLFYLPDRAASSSASPLASLQSSYADVAYIAEQLRMRLPEECPLICEPLTTLEDFDAYLMKTDHHWNIRGAVRGYSSIIRHFGFEPLVFEYYEAFEGPCFGSGARSGRCDAYAEPMLDVRYPKSGILQVAVNGAPVDESWLGCSLRPEGADALTDEQKKFDPYAAWFHNTEPFVEIVNPEIEGGTLLIINDSFASSIHRFFPEHYRTVYAIDPRSYDGSIDDFIASHDIDDAVFLLSTVSLFERSAYEGFKRIL